MSSKTSTKKSATKTAPKTPTQDVSQLKKDIRLIPIEEFDWSRLVYSEPKKSEVPDGSGHYRRVYIQYRYDDETIGPAIVEFSRKYCFGVQPDNMDKDGQVRKNKDGSLKELKGYQMPIVMTSVNKENPKPTEQEQREVDFLDDWKAEVARYCVENKKSLGKATKTDPQIEALVSEILYRKKNENGEIMEDVSPKLYAKLIYYPNKKQFGTPLYGPGDKEVNPLTAKNHFFVYPTLKFDNIFIGGTSISLQPRVYDATIEPTERTPVKRLARPNTMAASEATEETGEGDGENVEVVVGEEDVNDMMESEE